MLSVFSAFRRQARSSSDKDKPEGGYTLVELMVVSGIFLTVLSALLTTLEVASRQERRTAAIADNQQTVLNALQALTREIRAANPIRAGATSEEMRTAITVSTGSASDGDQKTFRFKVDSNGALVQEQVGTGVQRVLVPKLLNSPAQPVFSYFDDTGAELTTTGAAAVLPDVIVNCTTRVQIHIISEAPTKVGAPPPYEAVTSVEIRNKLPGGTGCQLP